ncbi:MAG: hypothetical protein WAL56_04015, partial [Candidatus Sulfotelmatobacter sp.]
MSPRTKVETTRNISRPAMKLRRFGVFNRKSFLDLKTASIAYQLGLEDIPSSKPRMEKKKSFRILPERKLGQVKPTEIPERTCPTTGAALATSATIPPMPATVWTAPRGEASLAPFAVVKLFPPPVAISQG